ncbi:MAG: DUF1385 domain-containing protein [Clostridia bacterium]|nr:DUF1385 domain-containing protein [Clostridia bacterium]
MSKQYAISRSRLEACSTHEGILMSSSSLSGDQSMCAYVKRNPDGTMEKMFFNQSIIAQSSDYKKEYHHEADFVSPRATVLQFFISAILAIIAIFGSKTIAIFALAFWAVMYFSNALSNVAYCIALAWYHQKYPSLSRYHGAEHMAIRAYEKYQRIPTLEEMREESIYDNNCSSIDTSLGPTIISLLNALILTITALPVIALVLYGLEHWKNVLVYGGVTLLFMVYLPTICLLLERVPNLVEKGFDSGFLTRLTQWMVVKTPTDAELEVAQEALKLRDLLNKMIEEDPEGFEVNMVNFNVIEKKAVYTYENGREAKITLDEYIGSIKAIRDAVEMEADA